MRELGRQTETPRQDSFDQLWPTKPAAVRKPVAGTNADMFAKLDADLFLAHHLFRRGRRASVLAGVMGVTQRREAIRREILASNLADEYRFGDRTQLSDETFAMAFERLYGEPLQLETQGELEC